MSNDVEDAAQPEPESGGNTRTAIPRLTGSALEFDLDDEVRDLRLEETWVRTGQNAKTLVKHPDFRIVLIAMRAGSRVHEHRAEGRVSIQCLSGRLRLSLPDRTVELRPAHMLVLDKSVAHDVEAIEEGALLLSISWPQGLAPLAD